MSSHYDVIDVVNECDVLWDMKVIQIPQSWIDNALAVIEHNAEVIDMIKHGEVPAVRCECCDWCKKTKKLTRVISAEELMLLNDY